MENPIYIDADVTIAPSYVLIAGATYPIDAVHSVRLEKLSGRISAGPIALIVIGSCVALLSLGGFVKGDTVAGTVVLTIGLALFALGMRELRRGGKYALIVSTSSGQQRILHGRRYEQLEMIRHVLGNAIMSAREAAPVQKRSDDGTKPCPLCAETIKTNAVVCRFCGHDLAAAAEPSVPEAEPDVAGRLRNLKALHDKDLITEAEYEEHRRALLAATFKVPT
ncbi:DUF6232 family protein [Azospirillum agricola]|uniref:DUF6232 family protein n=1 Tax=Azospirillum agricola TaxID=1720247 RepID=UPI000A0F1754|nr:DUF6232 family protein [Azospirillum agricola]SMH52070.1 Short C-terminal domain-containing protein [Azospirillum lipoferum]